MLLMKDNITTLLMDISQSYIRKHKRRRIQYDAAELNELETLYRNKTR